MINRKTDTGAQNACSFPVMYQTAIFPDNKCTPRKPSGIGWWLVSVGMLILVIITATQIRSHIASPVTTTLENNLGDTGQISWPIEKIQPDNSKGQLPTPVITGPVWVVVPQTSWTIKTRQKEVRAGTKGYVLETDGIWTDNAGTEYRLGVLIDNIPIPLSELDVVVTIRK